MIIINILGMSLIGLIIWWFWLHKEPDQKLNEGDISIEVKDGVYMPAHITVPAGKPFTLQFVRHDKSPCSEIVLIPELDISENLPVNKPCSVSLPSLEVGEYDFHCQMQMYRGVIKAV
ncbi:cupredoxin domain-containing protein [Vibrio sp. F74]|uniref:cupredoxin domain-containing protein n=1 Tax=Vibrio sp. F74 TaxID=700020 RepID=UPI0035F565D6